MHGAGAPGTPKQQLHLLQRRAARLSGLGAAAVAVVVRGRAVGQCVQRAAAGRKAAAQARHALPAPFESMGQTIAVCLPCVMYRPNILRWRHAANKPVPHIFCTGILLCNPMKLHSLTINS